MIALLRSINLRVILLVEVKMDIGEFKGSYKDLEGIFIKG
jgi:hypothetical protein